MNTYRVSRKYNFDDTILTCIERWSFKPRAYFLFKSLSLLYSFNHSCSLPLNVSSSAFSLFHLWAITLKYRAPEKTASREGMIPLHILWVTLQEGEIKFFKSLRSNENGNKSQWNAVPGPSYKRGSWVCFISLMSGAHRDLKWPLKIMQNLHN